eukprot:6661982-Prymnesium_polylepis.1
MGNSNLLSRKGHRVLIFPGKFLETENFKWARFPNANRLPVARAGRGACAVRAWLLAVLFVCVCCICMHCVPRVLEVGRGSCYRNPDFFSSDRGFTAEMGENVKKHHRRPVFRRGGQNRLSYRSSKTKA